jgi:uncharacterized protein (DUF1330 family)
MPAYVIAFVDIHDRTRFVQEYAAHFLPTLKPFGGRVLAASDEAETIEGAVPPGRIVVVEFPDIDTAHRWYASDAYAPLIKLREATATTSLVLLPGGFTIHN